MRITLIVLITLAVGGCGWFTKPDPVVVHEQNCEALRIVKFPDYQLPPIDTEPYKNIQLHTNNSSGKPRVCMTLADYKLYMQLLRETSNYIEGQNIIIIKMREFYEQGLDREELD